MSKRPGDLFINDSKKPKLSNLDSTFWDDDVDDDCFGEIASKILEQDATRHTQLSQANSSILPSYDTFRPNIPFASTQDTQAPLFKEPHKNYGIRNDEDVKELQIKVNFLQQKYEAKEGEVTVLRAQMQKIKSDAVENQNKKQKEYLEYTTLKEKEAKCIKGELEFKNLETANLKQRILEISKAVPNKNIENTKKKNINFSVMGDSSRKTNNPKRMERGIEISILQDPDLPLFSKFPSNFFTSHLPEVHVVQMKVNQYGRNTVPYIHNQMGQEEFALPSGPKVKMKIDKVEVGLEYIYPEILKIIESDIDQINSEDLKPALNKILCMSLQLLEYLKEYLAILEKHYRTEDIEELDKTFLEEHTCESVEKNINCEIGVRAGKTVQLIAELLPYSTYLADYILLGKNVEFDETLSKNIPCLKYASENNHYFNLLDDIIRKIFFLRKTGICHSFLNSVGLFLLNISKHNLYNNSFSKFCALTGSLLCTRPPFDVLHKLLIVVKNCSKSKYFVEYLCQKPETKKITTDKKRKMHYFVEESCKFTLFVALLHKNLQDIEDEIVSLDIAVNVISFIYNIFMMNPFWMHDQQKDQCICLEQLYQLAIGILYKSLVQFRCNKYTSLKDTYILVFKYGAKILRLLTFNSYDLMEKYLESHSKYREICCGLLELESDLNLMAEMNDLEKQGLSDEVPNIDSACLQLL